MTSRKNINIFDFNGVNVAKHWHVAGEVFAISDCLVMLCYVICKIRCFVENMQVTDTHVSDLDTLLFLQYINIIYSKYKLKRIPVPNDLWVSARVV